MILTCPACDTQYRLKDGAIPPEGRQVRCAACKHKWHQAGEGDAEAAPAPAPASAPADDGAIGQWPVAAGLGGGHGGEAGIAGGPPQPDAADAEPAAASVPELAADEQLIAANPEPEPDGDGYAGHVPAAEPVLAGDDRDAPAEPWRAEEQDHGFAAIPAMHDEEPARGGKLGWIIGLILLVVAAAAAFYFLAPPELKARAGIAEAVASPLQLMLTTSDRQQLPSGNELLTISGRVINSTDREQAVPPIHAELRDAATDRLVYQWTIAPPAPSLAAGGATNFYSAGVDVPKGGETLSLRFAS